MAGLVELDRALGILAEHAVDDTDVEMEVTFSGDSVDSAWGSGRPPTMCPCGRPTDVWFFISEEGQVLNRIVSQTSGHTQLDEAALQVADVFRFTPALNRDERVPVWIQLPITFQVN